MKNYLEHADKIEGWFNHKIMLPVLTSINELQSQSGNILEIGVHHGKSFIPMLYLLREDEHAIAVDIFEDQQFNYDKSGKGNKEIFIKNLNLVFDQKFLDKNLTIIKADSTQLTSQDLLNFYPNNNKYRIISIDGSHTKSATLKDLKNSIDIITDDGVIIIDDYKNENWPGVKAAVDDFLYQDNNFRVFFIDHKKFIICRREHYEKFNLKMKDMDANIANKYEYRCFLAGVWKR